MGATTVMNNCKYTQGVGCDNASDEKCSRCGFNPAVQRVRVAKIRNELKHSIIFGKKQRRSFVYDAPCSVKEENDVQGTD